MADDNITITRDPDPYDYDGIWKDFTREFWRDVLCDFLPELYVAADLERESEQLDKELHDILADLDTEAEKTPKRYQKTTRKPLDLAFCYNFSRITANEIPCIGKTSKGRSP